ncbi:MAG: hypothetical protein U0992_09435 [Planctomycetaceae bacterium]
MAYLRQPTFLTRGYPTAIILGVIQGIAEFSHQLEGAPGHRRTSAGGSTTTAADDRAAIQRHACFILVVPARCALALKNQRLVAAVAATLPLVIVGLFVKDIVTLYQSPLFAGCGLLVTALLIGLMPRVERAGRSPCRMSHGSRD